MTPRPHIICPGGVWDMSDPIQNHLRSGTPGFRLQSRLRTAPLLHTEHHNHTAYTCSRMGKPPFTAASTL
eukprot:4014713-Prymnesium_polylepis.1